MAEAEGTTGRPLVSETDFRAFYEETARGLWSYLYYLCQDRCWADDLLQESYLRLLQRAVRCESEPSLRGYLYRIAGNLFVDEYRRRRRERTLLPASHSDECFREPRTGAQDEAVSRLESQAECGELLLKLGARERELLWLAYGESATHREIAARLGVGERSVKVLLFRARRRLARLLGEGRS
jgi:RNA polymerase sigma-70 factor (ECF subfamily)